MGNNSKPNIASRGAFVKRQTPQTQQKTSKTQASSARSYRPEILSKLPLSCNLTFDVLRTMIDPQGQARVSVRYLANITHLSRQTVWRALRRLRGAHLIKQLETGKGGRPSLYQLCWKSPLVKFSTPLVTPPSSLYPEKEAVSPNGTVTGPKNTQRPSKRALAWAMAKLRRELTSYKISPERRKFILAGIGAALWRSMKAGTVRAGRQLGRIIEGAIARLRDAQGISHSLRAWCSFGGWAILSAVQEIEERRRSLEESQRLIAQIRREKAEAARSWEAVTWHSWRELLPIS